MAGTPAACAAAMMSFDQKVECMKTAIEENFDIDRRQVLKVSTPKMTFYDLVKDYMHECDLEKPGKRWEKAVVKAIRNLLDDAPRKSIEGVDKFKPSPEEAEPSARSNVKTFHFISPKYWNKVRPTHKMLYKTIWERNTKALNPSATVVVNAPPPFASFGSHPQMGDNPAAPEPDEGEIDHAESTSASEQESPILEVSNRPTRSGSQVQRLVSRRISDSEDEADKILRSDDESVQEAPVLSVQAQPAPDQRSEVDEDMVEEDSNSETGSTHDSEIVNREGDMELAEPILQEYPTKSDRETRATRKSSLTRIRSLGPVEHDPEGRIVYVDLRSKVLKEVLQLIELQKQLVRAIPKEQILNRMQPFKGNRVIVEIADPKLHSLFKSWMQSAIKRNVDLKSMLGSLGPRLKVLGGQFVLPKLTESDPKILPDRPHLDNWKKAEVISVAIEMRNGEMRTMLNPNIPANSEAIAKADLNDGFGSADTSAFAFDLATIHAGAGSDMVASVYPEYEKRRAFFTVCSESLDPVHMEKIRHDNGFKKDLGIIIEVSTEEEDQEAIHNDGSTRNQVQTLHSKASGRLRPVEFDQNERVVFVDMQTTETVGALELLQLQSALRTEMPSEQEGHRSRPVKYNRIRYEIENQKILKMFRSWMLSAVRRIPSLHCMLSPLGHRIRVLGGHFELPLSSRALPNSNPDKPHVIGKTKSEIIMVAIDLSNRPMQTMINAKMLTTDENLNRAVINEDFGSAMTPAYAIDSATVHAEVGRVEKGKYISAFETGRVSFLVCSDMIDTARIEEYRHINDFLVKHDVTMEIPLKGFHLETNERVNRYINAYLMNHDETTEIPFKGFILDSNEDVIYTAELFAGSGTCVRQMKKRYPNRAKGLLVDKKPAIEIGLEDLLVDNMSVFVQYDIKTLTYTQFDAWCRFYLGILVSRLDRLHISVECNNFSNVSRCAGDPQRDTDGNVLREEAQQTNIMIENLKSIVTEIRKRNSLILITWENPAKGPFLRCFPIQTMTTDKQWIVRKGDHCANADEELDGIVHGPVEFREGGLFCEKPSDWCILGVLPRFQLNQCARDGCRMKVPETNHHVISIMRPKGPIPHGQRLATKSQKARIPLGVHDKIWEAHIEWIERYDGHDYTCARCMQGGDLLCCDTKGCSLAQHEDCSSKLPVGNNKWFCDHCELEKWALTSGQKNRSISESEWISEALFTHMKKRHTD